MSEDVRGYLASKGIQLKNADKRNVHTACFWCGEDPQKRGRLYINTDENADIPGLFMCHICGEKGSLVKIKRYFGDPVNEDADHGLVHFDLLAAAATHFHKALNDHPGAVQYYEQERGLTRDTIRKFKLGWADGNLTPHVKKLGFNEQEMKAAGFLHSNGSEFFNGVYTIPYYLGPTCVGIRQKEPGGKYKQPSGFGQRPFNIDATRGADEVVLTEGEFDCMIAEQLGYAAVGIPGATQWQESWNHYVKDCRRIWVVFDNDEAGRKNSVKIEETIGPRAKALTIPPRQFGGDDDANDLSDWVVEQQHTAEEFTALLKKYRTTLLVTVAEAMTEWDGVQGAEGVKFNFEALDIAIHPGLLPGQVVVTGAKTNTGKTLWIENTFESMAQLNPDLRFLFMSLEQTRGDWFERAQRIKAFYHYEDGPASNDDEEIERFRQRIRKLTYKFWTPRLLLTDKNRMTVDHIRMTLDDFGQEMGQLPSVLAIDYLGYLANSFDAKDRYTKLTDAIMAVKGVAKDYQIPILVPSQLNRVGKDGERPSGDMLRDSGAIEETADFLFSLWNPDSGKTHGEGASRVHLGIEKSRHGGKGKEFTYAFGTHTLVMVPGKTGAGSGIERMACQEMHFPQREWPFAVWQHRTGGRS